MTKTISLAMLLFALFVSLTHALQGCNNDLNYNDGLSIPTKVTGLFSHFISAQRAASIANMASNVVHNFTAHPGLSPTLGGSIGNIVLTENLLGFLSTAGINGVKTELTLNATLMQRGTNFVKSVDEYVIFKAITFI